MLDVLGRDIGMWYWNIEAGQIEWSDRLYEIVGLSRTHFSPTVDNVNNLVHPDDLEAMRAHAKAHMEANTPYRYVFRVLHAEGHHIYCRTEASSQRDSAGKPVTMLGVTCDISVEMAAHDALRESERRLSTLTASFEGAIFRYRRNLNGTEAIEYISPGAERLWGLTPEMIEGDASSVWASVHADDVAGVEAVFTICTRDQKRLKHRWRHVMQDATLRWLECRAVPRKLASGDTVWDGFMIDVSETIAAREELRSTSEMLGQAQKMEAIGRIAGGIAHDFNNLLAIVLGNAELLDTQNFEKEDLESIDAIVNACQKGADLTRRLLSFARQSRLDPQRVPMTVIVNEMMPLLERTLPEDIHIRQEVDTDAQSFVEVDVGLLESSILNIMLNARDSMPNGGTITVRIANVSFTSDQTTRAGNVVPAGKYVLLEISDTGHGIPAELLERVTEPFVTSKGPEMGSGLGLAMVDGFIAQSGGLLQIDSREGVGTQISLCIPCASDPVDTVVSLSDPATTQPALRGRVLLVEDDVEVRLVIARVLRRFGLDVEAVADGSRAIAVLLDATRSIDLMISDIVIPGQPGGLDLARIAKARRADLPVILISGYSDESFRAEQERENLGIFLRKPVSRERLARVIGEVLSQDVTSP